MRLLGPLPKDVLEVVAEMTGYTTDEIRSERGRAGAARKLACWVSHRFGATWTELGRMYDVHRSAVQHWAYDVENDRPLLLAALAVVDVLNVRHAPAPEPLPFLESEKR